MTAIPRLLDLFCGAEALRVSAERGWLDGDV
jgi:hypothetical protein